MYEDNGDLDFSLHSDGYDELELEMSGSLDIDYIETQCLSTEIEDLQSRVLNRKDSDYLDREN